MDSVKNTFCRASLALILVLLFVTSPAPARDSLNSLDPDPEKLSEQQTFALNGMSEFNGQTILEIRLHGLKRTSANAVRLLLTQHPGDTFDPNIWMLGIHKLYNAGALYHIQTDIHPAAEGGLPVSNQLQNLQTNQGIIIDLSVQDRWTLVPFGNAQSGGGSFNLGGGLLDSNLFGYFIKGEVGYSSFDSVSTYQMTFSQEYLADTEWMWAAELSAIGTPVTFEKNDGSSLNKYTWLRHQERVLFGRRFKTVAIPLIRFYTNFLSFNDETVSGAGGSPSLNVEHGSQYRIRPTLILGRAQLTNFLEQGAELTFTPSFSNFFNQKTFHNSAGISAQPSVTRYSALSMSYKQAFIRRNTNFAFFLGGGLMDPAPAPYLYRLGGFDSVRGFATNRGIGRAYLNSNLEYRPYLFRFSPPILDELTGEWIIQGVVFQDAAVMWNSSSPVDSTRMNDHLFLLSHGVGLRGNILKFANCVGRIDFAHATSPNEGWGVAIGVGQFF